MEFRYIRVERNESIAIVTIDRPQALNALNTAVLVEIGTAMKELALYDDVRAIILTGAGDKAFVAGADIGEMANLTPVRAREFALTGQGVMNAIEDLPKPVIAAISGYALGGGCELAMACDIRIASDKAKLGQPEVGLGVCPGFGGTQRLPRLVGKGMAKKLIFTGEIIDAATAQQIGLVDMVVPHAELMAKAKELAMTIAQRAPFAVSQSKVAINRGTETDLATGLALEAECFAQTFSTEDQKEGMRAFLEKKKSVQFKGK
ncbi:MAG: enoyl-CoA hydratase-related protein [Bacillota bacterium]